jgi:hypothetical protein
LKNGAGETPQQLAEKYGAQHQSKKDELLTMFAESETNDIITPAVVLDKQREESAHKAAQDSFPTLKVLTRWTEDISAHRSASTPKHPITNVLSSDPTTYWLAPGIGRQWVIFDFGSVFTITSITLGVGPGKEMPKEFQVEVAPNMKGPWRVVHKDQLEKLNDGGGVEFQNFNAFQADTQFIKLQILRNYGAHETKVHSVSFEGVERKLRKFFVENGFNQYYDAFVGAGINQILDLPNISDQMLDSMVSLAGHRKKVQLAINKLKGSGRRLERLLFRGSPPDFAPVNQPIAAFEIHATTGMDDEVELVVLGGAEMVGTTKKRLQPTVGAPSVAIFDDIQLSPPGSYLFEVKLVANKEINCRAPRPIQIESSLEKVAIDALFEDYTSLLSF